MKRFILTVATIFLFSANLYAVQSASWEINSPDGFRKGEMQGAILSADGSLTTGATYTKIALAGQPITDEDAGFWCNVTIGDRIYFGSAKGIIYSLNQKEGKLDDVFNTNEMLVTTMIANKGDLYAGTLPNGKIFKIPARPDDAGRSGGDPAGPAKGGSPPEGEARPNGGASGGQGALFCTLPANGKYVWQLCLDNDGNLYAATGPEGKIYKIDATGKAEVFYDTKKKNVLSLIFNGKDYFYAGTASPGIVYRISLKGRPEIVADLGEVEIKCLVYSGEKGELFIGANKGIQAAPHEFLGLIQQSAKKAAVTPPVPGQAPKSADETKPATPAETPKHETPKEAPHSAPPPADKNHDEHRSDRDSDHQPPAKPQRSPDDFGAPSAPEHKSADKSARPNPTPVEQDGGQAGNPSDTAQDIPPELKEWLEKIKEAVPMQDEDGDEPPPMPVPPPAPVPIAPAGSAETVSVQPPPEAPRPPVHCVIYKLSNSFIKEIIALNDCYITEMKLNAEGVLIAGTDNSGRVYYVFQGGKFFIPFDLDAGQVLTLAMNKDNQLYAIGSGKKAAVYLARPDLAVKSEFTTEVWDARFPARLGNFSFKGRGSLALQVQSGNTAKPDETWSDWSDPVVISAQGGSASGGKAEEDAKPVAPAGRYFKAKLSWDNKDTLIKEITQNYLVHNQQPRIATFNIAPVPPLQLAGIPQRMPVRKITYQVRDPDGDALSYRIYSRREDQKTWILLNQEFPGGLIFQPEYNWNTESLPDGRYLIRLEATDEKVNPNGTELKDEKISEPVIVDNTRPEIKDLAVDKTLICSGKVSDALSQIRRIEYSLDGGKWEPVFPSDGIMDSSSEGFKFSLRPDEHPFGRVPATAAGFHNIAVRAYDEFGNMGLGQLEFERK
ncbi:MAG: hypothetical protein AB1599_04705 [Planctomycetota bacterium]